MSQGQLLEGRLCDGMGPSHVETLPATCFSSMRPEESGTRGAVRALEDA